MHNLTTILKILTFNTFEKRLISGLLPRQKNFACNLKRDFKSQAPTRAEYKY